MDKIIDIHTHFFAEYTFEEVPKEYSTEAPTIVEKSGTEAYVLTGKSAPIRVSKAFYSVKERIEEKSKEGVDIEVLSVHPSMFFYHVKVERAKVFSQLLNNAIYNIIRDNPDDFAGLANVPMQDVPSAIEEMTRAVKKLNMIGVELGSHINGRNLSDAVFWPFYKKAEELGALLFIHPNPINSIGGDRMSRYNLGLTIGNITETTLAAGSMILGGVFKEFPNLKVCYAHGGGFIPYQIGRLDQAFNIRHSSNGLKEPPSYYLNKIFVDTNVFNMKALEFLVNQMGEGSNVILGSDSPMDMHDHEIVSKIRALGLRDDKEKQILGGNMYKLLERRV